MSHDQYKPDTAPSRDTNPPVLNMWALSGEVGLIIAVPLVILMLIGIKLDKTFNTLPLFIIVALIISPVLSGIALWRRIKKLTV